MGEFFGDDRAMALQRSIRDRIPMISADPLLANGGRVLNVLDPKSWGWDRVKREAERDGVIALSMVDREATLRRLAEEYGSEQDFPYWEAFTGTPEGVLPACQAVLANNKLTDGWTVSHHTCPDDATIDASQALNMSTGVMPNPAYYLRSEHVPSMLTCLLTEDGTLAACASATMRYHPDGPLGGWLFAGGVSVSPTHRRRGLGAFVNAALIVESHARLGWRRIVEQAKADNEPSVGMITRCGLKQEPHKVTIIIDRTGAYLTR